MRESNKQNLSLNFTEFSISGEKMVTFKKQVDNKIPTCFLFFILKIQLYFLHTMQLQFPYTVPLCNYTIHLEVHYDQLHT